MVYWSKSPLKFLKNPGGDLIFDFDFFLDGPKDAGSWGFNVRRYLFNLCLSSSSLIGLGGDGDFFLGEGTLCGDFFLDDGIFTLCLSSKALMYFSRAVGERLKP